MQTTCRLLKKSASSTRWLARQSSDPYVRLRNAVGPSNRGAKSSPASEKAGQMDGAAAEGYRSRSSFKLVTICQKYPHLFRPLPYAPTSGSIRDGRQRQEQVVVDLGSAPGGWSQVARRMMGHRGQVFALDINVMDPVEGVRFIQGDFLDPAVQQQLQAEIAITRQEHSSELHVSSMAPASRESEARASHAAVETGEGFVDTVLSDMMAPMSGVRDRDVQASLDLVGAATAFAKATLRRAPAHQPAVLVRGQKVWPGGNLVLKYFAHPDMDEYRKDELEPSFARVVTVKPKESRSESSEAYWVCLGFKGS